MSPWTSTLWPIIRVFRGDADLSNIEASLNAGHTVSKPAANWDQAFSGPLWTAQLDAGSKLAAAIGAQTSAASRYRELGKAVSSPGWTALAASLQSLDALVGFRADLTAQQVADVISRFEGVRRYRDEELSSLPGWVSVSTAQGGVDVAPVLADEGESRFLLPGLLHPLRQMREWELKDWINFLMLVAAIWTIVASHVRPSLSSEDVEKLIREIDGRPPASAPTSTCPSPSTTTRSPDASQP
jgi:hypothetical protein